MLSPDGWLISLRLDIPESLDLQCWLSSMTTVLFGCGVAPMWPRPICHQYPRTTRTHRPHPSRRLRHEGSSPFHHVGNFQVSRTSASPPDLDGALHHAPPVSVLGEAMDRATRGYLTRCL